MVLFLCICWICWQFFLQCWYSMILDESIATSVFSSPSAPPSVRAKMFPLILLIFLIFLLFLVSHLQHPPSCPHTPHPHLIISHPTLFLLVHDRSSGMCASKIIVMLCVALKLWPQLIPKRQQNCDKRYFLKTWAQMLTDVGLCSLRVVLSCSFYPFPSFSF